MKQLYFFLLATLFLTTVKVQAQSSLSYQAVVRNSSNKLIENSPIGMKVSILQGTETGLVVYAEIHRPTSNANGLVTVEIGNGTIEAGTFSGINWANGPYFVKTETDLNGGSNYTVTSTNQFLSVPYALYALNSGSSTAGPQGIQGLKGDKGDKGDQGAIGLTGATGPKGDKGDQGVIGLTGATGEKGDKGDQGPIGLTGAAGEKGVQGIQGLQGAKGDQGTIGLTGPTGEKGDQGIQGIAGIKGDKGDKGDKGENGDVVLNNVPNLKVNLAATTVPAATDDTSKGYAIGSRWINVSTMKEYVCVKSGAGAAIWEITTPTQGNLPVGTEGQFLSYKSGNWVASNLTLTSFSGMAGSNVPINNLQPYLALNFQIALYGIYPSRNGADPFIGEIILTPYNYEVRDHASCNGQLLSVNTNSALFALLGTVYGGNGMTTFALPDLRGRVPVHMGQGPGLQRYELGQQSGTETTTLLLYNMPAHNHTITTTVNPN